MYVILRSSLSGNVNPATPIMYELTPKQNFGYGDNLSLHEIWEIKKSIGTFDTDYDYLDRYDRVDAF